MSHISNRTGFTLVEVLVALAIGAFICAGIYASFFSVHKVNIRVQESLIDRDAQILAFFVAIEKELNSAFYDKEHAATLFKLENRDSYGRPASRLSFTRRAPVSVAGSGMLAEIYTADDSGKHMVISKGVSDPVLDEKLKLYPFLDGVDAFKIECGDGTKWVSTWDTALNAALPRQVRIQLRISDGQQVRDYEEIYDIKTATAL